MCCKTAVPIAYAQSAYNLCGRVLEHQYTEHGGLGDSSRVIAKSQHLHRVLGGIFRPKSMNTGVPSVLPTWEVEEDALQWENNRVIEITGNIRGLVTYLSPSLKGNISKGDSFSYNGTAVPRRIHRELITLNDLLGKPDVAMVNTLDLIQPVLNRGGQASDRTDAAPMHYIKGSWNLTQIIQAATSLVSNHPYQNDCVLFIEEKAMIGLAPQNTQINDIVCQFEDSDIVVVLRENENGNPLYKVVGRAVPLLASSAEERVPFERLTSPKRGFTRGIFDVQPRSVRFEVSIPDLQLLTRESCYSRAYGTT